MTETTMAIVAQATRRGRRLNANLIAGIVLVGIIIVMVVMSYIWVPFNPETVYPGSRLLAPGFPHVLGTDPLGRDVFSYILTGARITLFVGICSVAIAAIIGVPMGMIGGLRSGWLGQLLMRTSDLLLAFPALLLAIIFGAVWGGSTTTAVLALGIGTAPAFARVCHSGTSQIMTQDYVLAARAAGKPTLYILARHVFPNIANVIIVQATVSFGIAVLAEAALSYLGLGTTPPTPSWGRMVQASQGYIYTDPALIFWPALAIAITVMGFNLLGDGLRDQLDPRMKDNR